MKEEKLLFICRTSYGVIPLQDQLVIDSQATGGENIKNDGFFEGMMFGLIIGSSI